MTDEKVKKPTLRSLVIAILVAFDAPEEYDTPLPIAALRAAVAPKAKKEKPLKQPKAKKESKHFDAMIADPQGAFERVMFYFVTKEGREALDLMQEPTIVSQSVFTLAKTQTHI
jgi:hypothetical protein